MAAHRFANGCHFLKRCRAHKWLMPGYVLGDDDVDRQRDLSPSHTLAVIAQHSGWIDCLRPLPAHRLLRVPLVLEREVELRL